MIADTIEAAVLSIVTATGSGKRVRGARSSLVRGVRILRWLEENGCAARIPIEALAFTFDVSLRTMMLDIAALIRAGEPISRAKGEVWFEALAVRAVAMPPHREI